MHVCVVYFFLILQFGKQAVPLHIHRSLCASLSGTCCACNLEGLGYKALHLVKAVLCFAALCFASPSLLLETHQRILGSVRKEEQRTASCSQCPSVNANTGKLKYAKKRCSGTCHKTIFFQGP